MKQDQRGRLVLPAADVRAQLPADGGPDYNRLIFESSPYLLQHADNPIDWYPWGDAAFERARAEDKPVFLSVGYATCHWCHVMAHESFEHDAVAAVLNRVFVCIKVDKEERPDIDDVYMTATQAMTGRGGWPMTVMMTADKQPFFAGTYFPRQSIGGRIGLVELAERVEQAWQNSRDTLHREAVSLAKHLGEMNRDTAGPSLNRETLDRCYEQLADRYDETHGGFGGAPKFPTPHNLTFLLRYGLRTGKPEAVDMVRDTLDAMRLGGIFDHVGFGFHRYSTDEFWLLPHFEKMLYDQALIAHAALETYQHTREPGLAETAREVFAYVLRDLRHPEGGFYSAQDADSEGEEGKFYVWRPEEITALLGPEDGAAYISLYAMKDEGNFHNEATGRLSGVNIPHLTVPIPLVDVERVAGWRGILAAARDKRVHPLKDDKVLTDWNGLMIAALAFGGAALDDPAYTAAAREAAAFVRRKLRRDDGRLHKRFREDQAGLTAHLDDYAFMIWGLIELYQADFDCDHLTWALELAGRVRELFWDEAAGGCFFTAGDSEAMIVRAKNIYDGALPSGNSVMAYNLLRLGALTGDTQWRDMGIGILEAFAGRVGHYPSMSNHLMGALDFHLGPTTELVIVGEPDAPDTRALLHLYRESFRPRCTVLLKHEAQAEALARTAPFTSEMHPLDGKAAAYVCHRFACAAPTNDPEELARLLHACA